MTTNPSSMSRIRPRPRDGLASVLLDGELVLYDSASRTLHHLNPTATLVWLRCDGDRTLGAIVRSIAEEQSSDADAILRDVIELVDRLTAAGLLVDARLPNS